MDYPDHSVPPLFITSYGRWSSYKNLRAMTTAGNQPASAALTANITTYMPLYLPCSYRVQRVFVANGAAVAGNWDFGLYSLEGSRIMNAGSTAQAGTNQLQFVSIDKWLNPGAYLMAFTCSSSSGQYFGSTIIAASSMRSAGYMQQNVGPALPAAATFAQLANGQLVVCGFTTTASGF